jgi:two-component system sensor histidine kinase LytS
VGKIAVPMIVMNSVGMVLFFKTFDMVYMREDSLFAERMRLSMGIADKSLVYLRKGFGKRENMEANLQQTPASPKLSMTSQKISMVIPL